jgi:8-oxo-dGTP pyrophosphatase MutT (NUDIX family)
VTDRFRVVPASYVLFLRAAPSGSAPVGGEQVLLQLRAGTGFMDGHWAAAAAGHVEAGESAVQAACREAAEELDVEVTAADLEPLTVMHRTQGSGDPIDERVDFFFACRRWSGEPRIVEPHKSAALEWFDLASPPEPVVPHELSVLTALWQHTLRPVTLHGFPSRDHAIPW